MRRRSPSDRRRADQPVLDQDAHVVGDQVRRHPERGRQLGGGPVAQREQLDDRQPAGVAEDRVQCCPPLDLGQPLSVH